MNNSLLDVGLRGPNQDKPFRVLSPNYGSPTHRPLITSRGYKPTTDTNPQRMCLHPRLFKKSQNFNVKIYEVKTNI